MRLPHSRLAAPADGTDRQCVRRCCCRGAGKPYTDEDLALHEGLLRLRLAHQQPAPWWVSIGVHRAGHTIILITSSALLLIRGCILCMHRPALSVPLASGLARARGLSPGPCRRGEAAGAPTRGEQCAFYGRELARDRGGSRLQQHELPAGRGVSQHGRLRLVAACVPHACLSSDRVVWRSVQPTLPIADATLAADRPGLHEAGQWRRHPRP